MKTYNFNKTVDRSISNSEKWNKKLLKEHFGVDNVLPFWIADMEFQTSGEIRKAISDYAFDEVLGYNNKSQLLIDSIISWHKKRFDWDIEKEHLRFSPSILNSIAALINIHTKEGDGIIIQTPVFFNFKQLIIKNNRQAVRNPLKLVDGKYKIDFEDLEKKAANPNNKILILCNPHNPVGRVWTKEELKKIEEITLRNDVLVISDEIHSGIIFKDYKFTPYSSISEEAKLNSVTVFSPAKTFNIPGASDSLVLIANKNLTKEFDTYMDRTASNKANSFNLIAMQAAYSQSNEWLNEVRNYLEENLEFMKEYIKKYIPEIKLIEPEGSFLVWLDFRGLKLDTLELQDFLAKKAKVALNSGFWFGREGAGFARMTIACPRDMLEKGLKNIESAIKKKNDK